MSINFFNAIRKKYRFNTAQGALLTMEDLCDLPLQHNSKPSLDSVAITLNRQLKQFSEESFVNKKSVGQSEVQEKLEIVKYIIEIKQKEEEARTNAANIKQQNQRLLELLAQKEDAELLNKSADDIKAMLKANAEALESLQSKF